MHEYAEPKIRIDSPGTPDEDKQWNEELAYFKTLNYSYDADQQYAIKHNIRCEHPDCNWIAESRCITCLQKKLGDHWFCRPFNLLDIEGYQYCFPRNIKLKYDNSHSDEHDKQVHEFKSMWKWISIREIPVEDKDK